MDGSPNQAVNEACHPRLRTRIVACQGAVQLASAIAAMCTAGLDRQTPDETESHLVIHDLSAPDGQVDEFAECIQVLAKKVVNWRSIRFMDREQVKTLQSDLASADATPQNVFQQRFGIDGCDELLVGQNDKLVPTWLRQANPSAHQICFGDGIAVNFTNSYYRPKEYAELLANQPWGRRLRRKLKEQWRRLRGKRAYTPTDFDLHCLLLENQFDQQLRNVQRMDPEWFVNLFELFGEDLESRAPAAHADLSRLQAKNASIVVLLTSNFSETDRMGLQGELEGYRHLLAALPYGSDASLIIKPHPRDSYEKIELLTRAVQDRYAECLALTDPWTFYLPFESIYAKYLTKESRTNGGDTHVATVSSACLSLELLYGQRCMLGFGASLVAQHFTPQWSDLRMIHERDLERIVRHIRDADARDRVRRAA